MEPRKEIENIGLLKCYDTKISRVQVKKEKLCAMYIIYSKLKAAGKFHNFIKINLGMSIVSHVRMI